MTLLLHFFYLEFGFVQLEYLARLSSLLNVKVCFEFVGLRELVLHDIFYCMLFKNTVCQIFL